MTLDTTPVDDTSLVGEWLLNATYISPGGTTEWKVVQEGARYFFDESGNYRLTDFNEDKTMLTLSPTYPVICIEGCLYRFKKQ